jgi:hypothetical protein
VPVACTVSIARQADDDLAYLTNTIPLEAMRSVLQYWSLGNLESSASMMVASAFLGTTRKRRERGGVLSGSSIASSSGLLSDSPVMTL